MIYAIIIFTHEEPHNNTVFTYYYYLQQPISRFHVSCTLPARQIRQ